MTLNSRSWGPRSIPAMFSEHIEPEPAASPAQKRRERAARFRESLSQKFRRVFGAMWHSSAQFPLAASLRVVDAVVRDKTIRARGAVDPAHALSEPDGFCALLDDVSAVSLMNVYGRGAYVDSGVTTASCWAPAQRRVIDMTQAVCEPASVPAKMTLVIDSHFDAVVMASNEAREISHSPKLLHAFCALFDTGMAHCVSLADTDGALVAGMFGVTVGRVFVVQGEFYGHVQQRRAVMTMLLSQLQQRGYVLADMSPLTNSDIPQVQSIPSAAYCDIVTENLAHGTHGRWRMKAAAVAEIAFAKAA